MSASSSQRHHGELQGGIQPPATVEVDEASPPPFCPNPKMPVWSSHPRVFLDLQVTGEAPCPYCGTLYRLKPGSVVKGHH